MLQQTDAAKRRTAAIVAGAAGVLVAMTYKHTFDKDYTTGDDLIEMGMFPGGNQLHSMEIIGEGVGVNTADVGFMTGLFGDIQDDTRDSADELFADADINGKSQTASTSACLAVEPPLDNVGIGLKLSANVAAGANKSVTLVLTYCA